MKAILKMNTAKHQEGFTLIELIIIIILIGILAATGSARFMALKKSVDNAACIENLQKLNVAQQAYYATVSTEGSGSTLTTEIDDLAPYLAGDALPACPSGGTYSLDADGYARCTIPEHVIDY